MIRKIIIFSFLLFSNNLNAFEYQGLEESQIEELMKDWQPIKVDSDAISWTIFKKTKAKMSCEIRDDLDYCVRKPIYSSEILALNNKKVKLMGYMFPLESSKKQHNFLFGPYPMSCPFHYHVGPAQFVEIIAKEPIEFSFDPIKVQGRLEVRFNEETEVFYYLQDAELI